MEIVNGILVLLHLVGFAMVLGGAVSQLPRAKEGAARIQPTMLWGVILLFITGLALVGMQYALGTSPDNAKIAVKFFVLLVLTGHVFSIRKKESISTGALWAIAGMALLNAALGVLW